LPSVPIVSMGYDQKHFCHDRGRGFEPVIQLQFDGAERVMRPWG